MIDFIAGGFELAASYAIGNKKRFGFLLNIVGCSTWIYVACTHKIYGLLLVVIPALVINARNYLKWRRDALRAKKPLHTTRCNDTIEIQDIKCSGCIRIIK